MTGYKSRDFLNFQEEIRGLSNVEKVLLDTADSVMDTKKKLEFGVQQIIFKVTFFIRKVQFQKKNCQTIKMIGEKGSMNHQKASETFA